MGPSFSWLSRCKLMYYDASEHHLQLGVVQDRDVFSLLLLGSVGDPVTITVTIASSAPCIQLTAMLSGQVVKTPKWWWVNHAKLGGEDHRLAMWWLCYRAGPAGWGGALESYSGKLTCVSQWCNQDSVPWVVLACVFVIWVSQTHQLQLMLDWGTHLMSAVLGGVEETVLKGGTGVVSVSKMNSIWISFLESLHWINFCFLYFSHFWFHSLVLKGFIYGSPCINLRRKKHNRALLF